MRCLSNLSWPRPASTDPPVPRRIELYAGRGRKENASAFLARGRGRRQAAEAGADLRSKYADSPRNASARYRCDADRASCPGLDPSTDLPYRGESNSVQGAGVKQTSRQRRVGRAFLAVIQRKVCPRISAQNGMHFPDGLLAESSSRNLCSERDALSQRRSKRKAHPGIPPQTGTHFLSHLLNSKTYAPSIPKLGRRRPKRNGRRSI